MAASLRIADHDVWRRFLRRFLVEEEVLACAVPVEHVLMPITPLRFGDKDVAEIALEEPAHIKDHGGEFGGAFATLELGAVFFDDGGGESDGGPVIGVQRGKRP